ncbi:hypothetical protein GCM10009817_41280 [Terrabacter lapilli]|uniref:DUF6471 domain-containing protein n=2 Tax=Terrabacter lapilli TaxID=436231 RepID=A0ABN2SY30_9MICO
MPRTNRGSIFAERYVAWHVEAELARRGWSYRELADRMTAAGAPANQSSIHKMLRQEPPRRIRVNELAALAEIFDVPMQELAQSVDRSLSEEANRLLADLYAAATPYREAAAKLSRTIRLLAVAVAASDEFTMKLMDAMARQEASMALLMDIAHEAEERMYAQAEADAEAHRLPRFVRRYHELRRRAEPEDGSDDGQHREED